MKRIEFIAPVEAMRGNLSGAQDLRYAENDNKAYESPAGNVNYARNYRPSFIGVKVSATGKKYFSLKQRSAVHMTNKAKKAMAVLGGAGSLYASLVRTKSSAIYVAIYAQWLALQDLGSTTSFRKWVTDIFMAGLRAKEQQFAFTGPNTTSYVNNPWVASSQTEGCSVSTFILHKFWTELASNGTIFTVDDVKCYGHVGDTIISSLTANNISYSIDVLNYIKIDSKYLTMGDDYMKDVNVITANAAYVTTDVQPE